MGKIIVDGAESAIVIPEAATVADAFEIARDEIHRTGRMVLDIVLGDRSLVWGDGAAEWRLPFDDAETLQIRTEHPFRLTLPLLDRMLELLPKVAAEHRAAAQALREGRQQDGVQLTLKALPWWKEMQEAFHQIHLLHGIDPGRGERELGELFQSNSKKLARQLGELHEAIEHGDFVLVADLLEYELAPATDDWQRTCQRFKEVLTERFSKEGEAHDESTVPKGDG